jgi:hypothetical protein
MHPVQRIRIETDHDNKGYQNPYQLDFPKELLDILAECQESYNSLSDEQKASYQKEADPEKIVAVERGLKRYDMDIVEKQLKALNPYILAQALKKYKNK